MATLAELLIKVGVDADELDSGMDGAARDVDQSFSKIEGSADQAGKAIDDAGDRASRAFTGVEGDLDRAGNALKGVGADADRAGTKIGQAGKEGGDGFASGLTSSLGGLGSKLSSSAGDALEDLKGEFAIGGAAAGAVLIASAAEAIDREKGSDQIAARLNLTAEQSAAAGRAAGNLYAGAWGDSVGHVNEAIDAVFSSLGDSLGPADDALEKTTAKALDLATGFGVDVVEATGIAGFAIESGLAKDADHAFDLMIASMQRMPASMREELFPAVEEYGTFLHNLGFTGEEAFGLLANASREGSFGIDKTADALKELTIRATDMSTTSVEAFEAAGLDADKMAARFLEGGDSAKGALDDLIEGLLGIKDPVERSNAAIGLFGTPLEDLSVSEIPQFLEGLTGIDSALGNVDGTAEQFGNTLNDNLGTRLESVKRKGIDALVSAAEQYLLPALEAVIGFAEAHPVAFQVMAIAVGALAVGFLALAVAAGVATLAAAPWIGTALLVAAVVAGIIFVVGLLIAFWPELSAAAGAAWDFVFQKGRTVFNWVRDNWPLLLTILTGPFGAAVWIITSHWDKIWGAGKAVFSWVRSNWPLLLAILTAPIGLAVLAIIRNFDKIVSFARGLPGKIKSGIGSLASLLVSAGGDLIRGLINGIKNMAGAAVDAAKNVVGSAVDGAKSLLGIGSPSKVFMEIGEDTMAGWRIGLDDTSPTIEHSVVAAAERLTRAAAHDPLSVNDFRSPRVSGLGQMEPGDRPIIFNVAGSIRSDQELIGLMRDALNHGGLRGAIR